MTLSLKFLSNPLMTLAFWGCFLSCEDGTLHTAGNAMFCQQACATDDDCTIQGYDKTYTCTDRRCVAQECTEDVNCQKGDGRGELICDKETGACICGPSTCGDYQKCMANGQCYDRCKNDDHCIKSIGDVCYRGVCGCSDVRVCKRFKTEFDGTTPVCEGL